MEQLIRGLSIKDRRGHFETAVNGIAADSRQIRSGDVFVAVRGRAADGHGFIRTAVDRGARAVVAEEWPDDLDDALATRPNVVLVPDSRRALALAAANFWGRPSRDLVMAGVTGTNGKTTVVHVLESILKAAGKAVGTIGTVGYRFGDRTEHATHTTPDPVELQSVLARMKRAGVTHVVMEVSSHALDQQRAVGVHLKVAGFTNLTQDHLDYHTDVEDYFLAKSRLFSEVLAGSEARGRMAVINVDDAYGARLLEIWKGKTLTASLSGAPEADLAVLSADYSLDETRATIRTRKGQLELTSPLVGPHNLANVLIAVGMAQAMGFSDHRIRTGVDSLRGVPGRLEAVPNDEDVRVFVDYAHTPDALRRVLEAVRPFTEGRLVVVFGCGGDRDRDKRSEMGRAAAEAADRVVLTSDNPRSEDPAAIAEQAEAGLREGGMTRLGADAEARGYEVELDRRQAIRVATARLRPGDVLVIAGKGHEQVQIVGDQRVPFDDVEEARRILAGLPPPPPPSRIGPTTQRVETEQVVESVDIEPDIVGEAPDDAREPD